MPISDREKLVLNAIINYYLSYGDTIGSRTLVKKYGIDLSSATIRNVMADLEDMGYIEKTHTSSGRIPTDKGYKYYLNELIKVEKITQEEKNSIESAYEQRINELDMLLKRTSSLLSKLTNYAGVAVEPSTLVDRTRKIELIHIDPYVVLMVLIRESRAVRTKKIYLKNQINPDELAQISTELNAMCETHNVTAADVESAIQQYQMSNIINDTSASDNDNIIDDVFDKVDDIEAEVDAQEKFFVHNMPSIFKDKNVSEVSDILEVFNNRSDMVQIFENIVRENKTENGKVNVIFGDELGIKGMEEYSFVYSVYKVGESEGILGVLGPKRMAYSKTVGLIKHVTKEVNKVINKIENKNDKKE